ncbi:MAG: anti-sigma factor domain-containing protein, partial [Acidimicrobiales bacterium]
APAPTSLAGRRRPARKWLMRPAVAVAAAAAIIIGGLSYELSSLQGQLSSVRTAVQASASAEHPQAILSRLISDALLAPGHQLVKLSSSGGGLQAKAVLLPSGRGYLVRSSLPRLTASQTYQLWAQVRGRLVSVAVLGPDPGQQAFSVGPGVPVAKLMVTVEPKGGVTRPSQAPVVAGAPASA